MNKVEELLEKYNNGTATAEEKALVESWYLSYKTPEGNLSQEQIREEFETGLADLSGRTSGKRLSLWPHIAAAASILLFLTIGTYFFWRRTQSLQTAAVQKQDIAPGGNKAILTLANGRQIILTGAKNGLLASQGNTKINKTANGQVIYNVSKIATSGGDLEGTTSYNTMTTPRGGQYQLTLADGTEVWLNAASSIKYPTSFAGKDRQVEITGEAYFEVAHNATKPFRVTSNGQTVEVLGTHFNVNAYTDEPAMKTTLLEGSIKIAKAGQITLLKPGQQALVNGNKAIQIINNANTEEAVAWKNGYLRFNDEKIESIMRKLSRWYDIDVKFEGRISPEGFNGKISRYKNIGQVLKMLEYSKSVHFKVEERRVTVTM